MKALSIYHLLFRDDIGSLQGATQRPPWASLPFMYGARLLPLLKRHAATSTATWPNEVLTEAGGLVSVIAKMQRLLQAELIEFSSVLNGRGIVPLVIKGADSLLFGSEALGGGHTRDLDVVIDESELQITKEVLRLIGFRQLRYAGLDTDAVVCITPQELEEAERGYYGYFPWTKLVDFPVEDREYEDVIKVLELGRDVFPLLVRKKTRELRMAVQIDLHHSMWPGVPRPSLKVVRGAYGSVELERLVLSDVLLIQGVQLAKRLFQDGRTFVWGALAQVAQRVVREATPEIYEACDSRASQLDLQRPWFTFSTLLAGLGLHCEADMRRFPTYDEQSIPLALNAAAQKWPASFG